MLKCGSKESALNLFLGLHDNTQAAQQEVEMSLTYLVCFDIENDKARRKVGNLLLAYGDRVQYSVFEIALTNQSQLTELKYRLSKILHQHPNPDDDLRFYYLAGTFFHA